VKYSEPFAYCSWQGLSGGEVEYLKSTKSIEYFRGDGIMNIEYAIDLKFKRMIDAARFILMLFKISSVFPSFSQNFMMLYRDSFDASGSKIDRFHNIENIYKVFFYNEPFKNDMAFELGNLRNATALIMGIRLSDKDKMDKMYNELREYVEKRTQE
jgi:hypothetical protein